MPRFGGVQGGVKGDNKTSPGLLVHPPARWDILRSEPHPLGHPPVGSPLCVCRSLQENASCPYIPCCSYAFLVLFLCFLNGIIKTRPVGTSPGHLSGESKVQALSVTMISQQKITTKRSKREALILGPWALDRGMSQWAGGCPNRPGDVPVVGSYPASWDELSGHSCQDIGQ